MPDPVQDTVQQTQDRLSTGWRDWAVTPADLHNIASDLHRLTPAQRKAVIESLADDDLQKLAGEIMQSRPLLGGLGSEDRQALFSDLARGLDRQQLGRVATAFATTGGDSDGFTPVGELAQAVAAHGGTQQKLDFLRELAPLTTDRSAFVTTGLGYSDTTYADSQAAAAGVVLGSLRGQAAAEGLSMLNDAQLRAIVGSSIQGSSFHSGLGGNTSASFSWDTQGYDNLAQAAASARSIGGSNPADGAEAKARFFDAAGDALVGVSETSTIPGGLVVIGKADAEASVAEGMSAVLRSDTTGVMTELTYDQRFDEGTAMTAFSKAMLNAGGEYQLGEIMAQLQFGNDGSRNPVDHLEQQIDLGNGRTINANAGALGYFVGSVYAAADQISSDIADQQEIVTAVLKSALVVVDKTQPWGRVTGIAAATAKEWVAIGVKAAIEDPGAAPGQRLEDAALPSDGNNNRAISDAANSAFDDSISKVRRNNL